MTKTLKELILDRFKTESECARTLGWSRQRLNKITQRKKEPSVYELNALAKVLRMPIGDLVPIFLDR